MSDTSLATLARTSLGGMLVLTGVGHLTVAREAFQAQVPDWVPLPKDTTVLLSGVAEVALGSALLLAGRGHRAAVGRVAAAFFVAVFPGNVSQYIHHRSAFGLDTDAKRFVRLLFQPALAYWALRSTREPGRGATRGRPDA